MTAALMMAGLGCNTADDGSIGLQTLVTASAEAPGDNCANGGNRIDYGVDENRNETLDPSEIGGTSYACDGTAGSDGTATLVTATAEDAGADCAGGGNRIDYGSDDNGDGALDDSEIDGTTYVCSGTDALQQLITATTEPAGANCTAGGIRIDYGLDDSGDGALDPSETDGSTYVCNGETGSPGAAGPAGLPTLIVSTPEPDGANCAASGTRFDYGLDDDQNGSLGTSEVDGTTYVCNGALGLPNGLGGTYIPRSTNKQVNALAACESEHGAGNCCNDGCGSCNQLGYHLCGAPNCNGSVYWNYANNAQNMNCGWVDPNEILISLDGVTWQQ